MRVAYCEKCDDLYAACGHWHSDAECVLKSFKAPRNESIKLDAFYDKVVRRTLCKTLVEDAPLQLDFIDREWWVSCQECRNLVGVTYCEKCCSYYAICEHQHSDAECILKMFQRDRTLVGA